MNNETDTDTISQASGEFDKLERTCFLIMPFGKKDVGGKVIDFTKIYTEIFEPAIKKVETPEKEFLIPARTDMDAFSGSINQDMFEYIMYSRLAFADISGFNPNVFYEIGARHSAQEAGTVLFRQTGHAIPFDITSIKVFEYDFLTEAEAEKSRDFITNVLSETLKRNRLDSPVRLALRAQWGGSPEPKPGSKTQVGPMEKSSAAAPGADYWRKQEVERFLLDAEEAVRLDDLEMACTCYWGALRFDPLNVIARMRLGLVLKRQGRYYDALEEFTTVTKLAPNYGEAWREKGVIEGLIARKIPKDVRKKELWLPDGYDSLQRATRLNPDDFDAWSSLGGVLKNVRGDNAAALKMYDHAAKISDGHPYPLLNAMKLQAQNTGKLDVEPLREQLEAAEKLRKGQTLSTPPTDTPWSYFDLAEISLYLGKKNAFLENIKMGVKSCNEKWQPETFLRSLVTTLVDKSIDLDGLAEGLEILKKAISAYDKA